MRLRIPFLADACQVVRPVLVCLGAITILAVAMAVKGWQAASLGMGSVIAAISAVAIYQVHRSVTRLRDQSSAVEDAAVQAETHYADVLTRIVRFVESRDHYIEGHSERVGGLSEKVALQMGVPSDKAALLNLAGQLHDVGLLAVPAETLAQPRRLSAESFRRVKQHCGIGYEILQPLRSLGPVLLAVRHHHERMNGTGYPDGLAGEDIPAEARILAVADSFDAMTHDRPHRQAIPPVEAVAELHRCSPAGYDPLCVEALSEAVFGSSRARPSAVSAESGIGSDATDRRAPHPVKDS